MAQCPHRLHVGTDDADAYPDDILDCVYEDGHDGLHAAEADGFGVIGFLDVPVHYTVRWEPIDEPTPGEAQ